MHRILFMGQKKIGEKCFDILNNADDDLFKVCAAVSNESKDVWWESNQIFKQTNFDDIPFIDNGKRNNLIVQEMIDEQDINMIICVQHPWIIPSCILEMVDYNAFNIHNAKLPDYKGHNACNHAILNGDKTFTCTLHWIADEVDTGDIVLEESFNIEKHDTATSIYGKATYAGVALFYQLLIDLKYKIPLSKIKIKGEGRFYPRNSIDDLREIENINDPAEVDVKARAFCFPYFEKAYYILDNKKYYIIPEEAL